MNKIINTELIKTLNTFYLGDTEISTFEMEKKTNKGERIFGKQVFFKNKDESDYKPLIIDNYYIIEIDEIKKDFFKDKKLFGANAVSDIDEYFEIYEKEGIIYDTKILILNEDLEQEDFKIKNSRGDLIIELGKGNRFLIGDRVNIMDKVYYKIYSYFDDGSTFDCYIDRNYNILETSNGKIVTHIWDIRENIDELKTKRIFISTDEGTFETNLTDFIASSNLKFPLLNIMVEKGPEDGLDSEYFIIDGNLKKVAELIT